VVTGALLDRARALLEQNTQQGVKDGRTYTFSVPSIGQYPFQWFWDSCFHAIVWARIDPLRAQEELLGLLAWQEPDGFIPHVIFWDRSRVRRSLTSFHFLESGKLSLLLPGGPKPATTRHMQPPVIAQAVERVVDASGDDGFLQEALPALERYYRWLAKRRDLDEDRLISIIAQFESGLDYSPAYDPLIGADGRGPRWIVARSRWPELQNAVRYRFDLDRILRETEYHQEDVLVNAVYAQGLEALARLAARAHQAPLAAWASVQSTRVTQALLSRCYDRDAGLFWNLGGTREQRSRVRTVISLMPLILDIPADVAASVTSHLSDPAQFWAPYPVPSVALHEPSFVPGIHVRGRRLIWRGPLSMNTNWFLVSGLRRHGEDELAGVIVARSQELVERGGFNEFYDPFSGEPVGAVEFGWATLVCDMNPRPGRGQAS
jgi:glycogen debranching enzyme